MKLKDYALLAEVVSAIAIIVSLIYVGIQVKDNAVAVRASAANDAAALAMSWYTNVGSDAQRSTLLLNGMTNPETLSREEKYQFTMMVQGVMLAFQNAFYLSETGVLEKDIRDTMTRTLLTVKDQPGFHQFWQERRALFRDSFAFYVDELFDADKNILHRTYTPEKMSSKQ